MLESYWNLVKNTGRFWLDGNLRFQVQGSAPSTPPSGNFEFYAKSTGLFIKNSSGTEIGPLSVGITDHGGLTGLLDDDHTIHPLLLGRSGGQTLIGGTAASNNLFLRSTSNATKGGIIFGDASGGSVHPTLSSDYHQFYKVSTSVGPDVQIANDATADASSLGALEWGTRGASNSDKRTALLHVRLVGSGATHPAGRLEFYTRIAGGATFNQMTFSELGRLGIGSNAASPSFGVHAVGASPNCHVSGNRLSADALGPAFIGQKARGTPGSPSVVLADDQLCQIVGQGYENGSYHTQTNIKLWAAENWTGSAKGTYITFETAATGGTTISERLRIEASGDVSHASGVRHRMLSQNRFRHLNIICRATKITTNQTLTHDTVTAITFNSETIDTDGVHSTVSATSRFTAPIAGKYLALGGVTFANGSDSTQRLIAIQHSSGTIYAQQRQVAENGDVAVLSTADVLTMAAGEYMEVIARHKHGSDLAVTIGEATFGALIYIGE